MTRARTASGALLAALTAVATGCSSSDGGSSHGPTSTGPAATSSSTTTAPAGETTTSSVVTTTTAADRVLSSTSRLRLDGIGPVKVGMTLEEASRAIGTRLRVDPDSSPEPASCGFAAPPGGPQVDFYESPEPSQRGFLLILETDGSKVTSFRAGRRGAVELIEDCL